MIANRLFSAIDTITREADKMDRALVSPSDSRMVGNGDLNLASFNELHTERG